MNAHDILLRPVLTEKGYSAISQKTYAFVVAKNSTKTQIKNAVEEIFGVNVAKVNTVNYDGKVKRLGRHEGKTAGYKKAVVTLTSDSKSIEFFDSLAV